MSMIENPFTALATSNLPFAVGGDVAANAQVLKRESGMDNILAADSLVSETLRDPTRFLANRETYHNAVITQTIGFVTALDTALQDLLGDEAIGGDNVRYAALRNELAKKISKNIVSMVMNEVEQVINPIKDRVLEKLTYTRTR